MRSCSLVAGLSLLVAGVQSFGRPVTLFTSYHYQPNAGPPSTSSTQLRMAPPPDAPAGSFFNLVPSNDDDKEKNKNKKQQVPPPPMPIVPESTTTDIGSSSDDNKDDLDEKLSQLLRERQKPPRASSPSTINGVPTEKASGFGKPKEAKPPKKPFVAIGPPDEPPPKPINDPTNPEYDDQGYTLYADEKTGKKSRVFEALVDYPCEFTIKIVGVNEGLFVQEMIAVVAEACEAEVQSISHSFRAMGKWTSLTVKAPVKSAEMLYTLYEKVDLDPRVKFKF